MTYRGKVPIEHVPGISPAAKLTSGHASSSGKPRATGLSAIKLESVSCEANAAQVALSNSGPG